MSGDPQPRSPLPSAGQRGSYVGAKLWDRPDTKRATRRVPCRSGRSKTMTEHGGCHVSSDLPPSRFPRFGPEATSSRGTMIISHMLSELGRRWPGSARLLWPANRAGAPNRQASIWNRTADRRVGRARKRLVWGRARS